MNDHGMKHTPKDPRGGITEDDVDSRGKRPLETAFGQRGLLPSLVGSALAALMALTRQTPQTTRRQPRRLLVP